MSERSGCAETRSEKEAMERSEKEAMERSERMMNICSEMELGSEGEEDVAESADRR